MNTNISTRITINGQQVDKVVVAGNVPNMTKTIDFKIFEGKRSVRKSVLKDVARKENDFGLLH